MESLRGATSSTVNPAVFAQTIARYEHVLIDLGTGDGRFVRHVARTQPGWFVVGIDACRENLRAASRATPNNVQFLIANALDLPHSLWGAATHVTVNFPWGSLLRGLLDEACGLHQSLAAIARPGAVLEIRLNAGALAEAGWELAPAASQIRRLLEAHQFRCQRPTALDVATLRACHTTWAKRIAFGRDPRGLHIRAVRHVCAGQADISEYDHL